MTEEGWKCLSFSRLRDASELGFESLACEWGVRVPPQMPRGAALVSDAYRAEGAAAVGDSRSVHSSRGQELQLAVVEEAAAVGEEAAAVGEGGSRSVHSSRGEELLLAVVEEAAAVGEEAAAVGEGGSRSVHSSRGEELLPAVVGVSARSEEARPAASFAVEKDGASEEVAGSSSAEVRHHHTNTCAPSAPSTLLHLCWI
jgi:hypothetical protein